MIWMPLISDLRSLDGFAVHATLVRNITTIGMSMMRAPVVARLLVLTTIATRGQELPAVAVPVLMKVWGMRQIIF
jgi:hypothetical protein